MGGGRAHLNADQEPNLASAWSPRPALSLFYTVFFNQILVLYKGVMVLKGMCFFKLGHVITENLNLKNATI